MANEIYLVNLNWTLSLCGGRDGMCVKIREESGGSIEPHFCTVEHDDEDPLSVNYPI